MSEAASSPSSGGSLSRINAPPKCALCGKGVYPLEKIDACEKVWHKGCFRCKHCNGVLGLKGFATINNDPYCKPHYMELFKSKGNYAVFSGEEKGGTTYTGMGFVGVNALRKDAEKPNSGSVISPVISPVDSPAEESAKQDTRPKEVMQSPTSGGTTQKSISETKSTPPQDDRSDNKVTAREEEIRKSRQDRDKQAEAEKQAKLVAKLQPKKEEYTLGPAATKAEIQSTSKPTSFGSPSISTKPLDTSQVKPSVFQQTENKQLEDDRKNFEEEKKKIDQERKRLSSALASERAALEQEKKKYEEEMKKIAEERKKLAATLDKERRLLEEDKKKSEASRPPLSNSSGGPSPSPTGTGTPVTNRSLNNSANTRPASPQVEKKPAQTPSSAKPVEEMKPTATGTPDSPNPRKAFEVDSPNPRKAFEVDSPSGSSSPGGSKSMRVIPPKCALCGKGVYHLEKIDACEKVWHKGCFRCKHCNGVLGLKGFATINNDPYCKPHYMELFKSKGNYAVFSGEEKGGTTYTGMGFVGVDVMQRANKEDAKAKEES
eukprot:TRINITY_DN589_c0_g1_i4.p1 TRINITY_DN589_c0_g1~~TRINITY_DN589_c0_g1_i4.p1  ORF type:complete len:546 (+),score=167.63 TRINITY_DN589_c0_g1_i4:135-1772(+)